MDEVAEDGEGAGVRVLECERDGIAHAETHAEVGRSENLAYFTLQSILRSKSLGKLARDLWPRQPRVAQLSCLATRRTSAIVKSSMRVIAASSTLAIASPGV